MEGQQIEIPEKYKNFEFIQPTKQIKQEQDLELFNKSDIYGEYMTFISQLQQSILSKKISETGKNQKFDRIVKFLQDLIELVDQVPPLSQQMRFGNTAFKTWHQKAMEIADKFLEEYLPKEIQNASIELKTYIMDSFGSNVRIDYGTGHEMAFTFFLMGLKKLNFYQQADFEYLVRNVFYKYISLMRKIQLTYMQEPAGSHGVWGLDDYHFLPFLFGAAELVDNQIAPSPEDIHKQHILDEYHSEYMYLECIRFIKQVKKGPFHEHSPMLNDISGAASWTKVMNGMIKMYQAEVLHKFPVAKHIFFGNLMPLK